MKNILTTLLCLGITLSTFANDTKTEFEKLKTLEGKWVGTLERTDGTSDF